MASPKLLRLFTVRSVYPVSLCSSDSAQLLCPESASSSLLTAAHNHHQAPLANAPAEVQRHLYNVLIYILFCRHIIFLTLNSYRLCFILHSWSIKDHDFVISEELSLHRSSLVQTPSGVPSASYFVPLNQPCFLSFPWGLNKTVSNPQAILRILTLDLLLPVLVRDLATRPGILHSKSALDQQGSVEHCSCGVHICLPQSWVTFLEACFPVCRRFTTVLRKQGLEDRLLNHCQYRASRVHNTSKNSA